MQCLIDGCSEQFIDNSTGLAEMTFHVMIHHPANEINGVNVVEERIEDGGESY